MSSIVFDIETGGTLLVVKSKTHGEYSNFINREEAEKVAEHNWRVWKRNNTDRVYFLTAIKNPDNKYIGLYLHRFIMDAPSDMLVDHKDPSATLDNRKSNLRLATTHENQHNQRPQIGRGSRFKGVSWFKPTSKWQVHIRVNGKQKNLGLYSSETDAARAYDARALELFGEFAHLNFHIAA
jgi:hypothetical protein